MLDTEKLSKLLLDVADCYTILSGNKYFASYRSDTDFAPRLRGFNSTLTDEHGKKSKIIEELDSYLSEKFEGKEITSRVYQLAKLLQFVVRVQREDVNPTQIHKLLDQVGTHRKEVNKQENSLGYLSQDPEYLKKFNDFADRVETILTKNLPTDEQEIQAQKRLEATEKYEKSTQAMIANGIDVMTSPVSSTKEDDQNSKIQGQLVTYMEQLAAARAQQKRAEAAKRELEAERAKLAAKKKAADVELNKSRKEVDHARFAMKMLRDENRALQREVDDLKDERANCFAITKKQFKQLVKTSAPLQLALKLIQLSIMIERVYQQFESNSKRDTGQRRNFKAYYCYFSGLLPCLTDPGARAKYLRDRNSAEKEAILDADERICKAVLRFVLGTAQHGAYTIADLTGPMVNAVKGQGASEEATKAFYAAIEKNAMSLKKLTGIANEFYKLAFHIDNGDFDRTVRQWGEFITENKQQLLDLAYDELGITPQLAASDKVDKGKGKEKDKKADEADQAASSGSDDKRKYRSKRPGGR